MVENLIDLPPHRPVHEFQVALLGQNDVDIETTQGGRVEGIDERLVRQKIGRDNFDGARRAGDGPHERKVQYVQICIGAVDDAACDGSADGREFGKPMRAVE